MPRTDCSPLAASEARADPVRAQAARWFARARSGTWTDAAQAELDAWLARDPRHASEYRMLEEIWLAAGSIPADRLRELAEPPPRPASRMRRQALGLGLCALAAGVAVAIWRPGDGMAEYRTAAGERRSVTLPDGSIVELNSRSRLQVGFDDARRRVVLQAGQALFTVREDMARPFIVDAGFGSARVTGTRFDVRRDTDRMQVVVESGSVEVAGAQDAAAVAVAAGNSVLVDASGHAGRARPVAVAVELAWRNGQIVFADADLRSAVREVSRYREQPVVLATGQGLEDLRLTSVFQTADTDAFLTALPHILPVAVRRLPDGRAEIVAR